MMIPLDHTVTATPDHVTTRIDQDLILLDTKKGKYFELNEIGSRIWTLIQSPISVDELLYVLLAEYDVERSRCESDLQVLLTTLVQEELVLVSQRVAV